MYYPCGLVGLAAGCVAVEVEELVEALLGGVVVGDDATCSGSTAVALVEEDGFLDSGEGGEEATYGEVESGVGGVTDHEVSDL